MGSLDGLQLLSACLPSFALDYLARPRVGGVHLNFFIAHQLPVPNPATIAGPMPSTAVPMGDWLRPRLSELVYTSYDMQPFARDLGDDGPPFRWDPQRRFLLRAELDAAFFHLYGVQRDDVDYILDTFPIVRRKDEQAYGEYRTKRVILEVYDAMAEAIATGAPYRTILDPPPGNGPRHPAR